jgi:hypothetical protein
VPQTALLECAETGGERSCLWAQLRIRKPHLRLCHLRRTLIGDTVALVIWGRLAEVGADSLATHANNVLLFVCG